MNMSLSNLDSLPCLWKCYKYTHSKYCSATIGNESNLCVLTYNSFRRGDKMLLARRKSNPIFSDPNVKRIYITSDQFVSRINYFSKKM